MNKTEKDIQKIKNLAKIYNISIWEASKMFRNYKKATGSQNCNRCKNKMSVTFSDRTALQCEEIGISGHRDADLSVNCVCDKYRH